MTKRKNKAKAKAGQKGGKSTAEKYGLEYMKTIGRKGGKKTSQLYKRIPISMNDFLIVERETGRVRPYTLNGKKAPIEVYK